MNPARPPRRLRVAHVVYRFAIGGMENGLVNLINRLPESRYVHDIVCLTDFDPEFARRIRTTNVQLHRLDKRDGHDPRTLLNIALLLRRLRPDIVHTRNFGTLESQIAAWALAIAARIHGEHGWDMQDLLGVNRRHRLVRRALARLVHRFVTVSRDLQSYLVESVGIDAGRVRQIYNGVDTLRFSPAPAGAPAHPRFLIGAVGRLMEVKNHRFLVDAYVRMLQLHPELAGRVELRIVGDGPLRQGLIEQLDRAGLDGRACLPGASETVPEVLRDLDLFVLPSLAEGISNTVLEAMATGLPVIATRVGGNVELVVDGTTGALVEPGHVEELARMMARYAAEPALARGHGAAARALVESRFSIDAMIAAYDDLYTSLAGAA
ncbi:MAG: TIGR03088 family PEP-CTERM/XrtA system glycosyltransferase [Gammaproteobacteria bacterium]